MRKRTQTFEHFFCNFAVKHFKQLTLLDQLTCLSVAIMPDRANQSLSLLHYLRTNDLLLSTATQPLNSTFADAQTPDDQFAFPAVKSQPGVCEATERIGAEACHSDARNTHNNLNNINYDNVSKSYVNAIYPTLPDYLCQEIDQLKENLGSEHHVMMCQDLTERIITFLSKTVASELSRIFEYQLSLTQENIALRLLAKFACNNIFEAVRTRGRLLDRNSMVTSAMATNTPRRSHGDEGMPIPKWISVFSFGKELKWNIYDVFRKPALRKETCHTFIGHCFCNVQGNSSYQSFSQRSPMASPGLRSHRRQPPLSQSYMLFDQTLPCPFTFFSCADSDAMVYGYRAQVVEYCFIKSTYKFACADDSRHTEELPWRYDDIHRLYSPYLRLVSDVSMLEYVEWFRANEAEKLERASLKSNFEDFDDEEDLQKTATAAFPTLGGLEEWLRRMRSGAHVRDAISMVYKPFLSSVDVGEERWKDVQALVLQIQQRQNRFSTCSDYQQLSEVRSSIPVLPPKQFSPSENNSAHQQKPPPPPPLPQKQQHLHQQQHQQLPQHQQQQQPQQQQQNVSNGSKGDEMLRQELAQVTMQCDQLCFNLKDIG